MELITGLEPVTSYLPSKCSTAELYEPELQYPNLRWRIIPLKIDKLNLFRSKYSIKKWWRRLDSNQRTRREQIYSLAFNHSATPPFQGCYFCSRMNLSQLDY